jgi:hypothetical protein
MAWTGATRRLPHSVIGKIIFKSSDGTLEKLDRQLLTFDWS